jgi:hypothetical protein
MANGRPEPVRPRIQTTSAAVRKPGRTDRKPAGPDISCPQRTRPSTRVDTGPAAADPRIASPSTPRPSGPTPPQRSGREPQRRGQDLRHDRRIRAGRRHAAAARHPSSRTGHADTASRPDHLCGSGRPPQAQPTVVAASDRSLRGRPHPSARRPCGATVTGHPSTGARNCGHAGPLRMTSLDRRALLHQRRTVNPLLDGRICDPPEGDEDQPSHSMVEPLLVLRPSQGR